MTKDHQSGDGLAFIGPDGEEQQGAIPVQPGGLIGRRGLFGKAALMAASIAAGALGGKEVDSGAIADLEKKLVEQQQKQLRLYVLEVWDIYTGIGSYFHPLPPGAKSYDLYTDYVDGRIFAPDAEQGNINPYLKLGFSNKEHDRGTAFMNIYNACMEGNKVNVLPQEAALIVAYVLTKNNHVSPEDPVGQTADDIGLRLLDDFFARVNGLGRAITPLQGEFEYKLLMNQTSLEPLSDEKLFTDVHVPKDAEKAKRDRDMAIAQRAIEMLKRALPPK